ncbi:MAG: hypothetical protein DMD67_13070 [Gemmatimonadetes bacterium]|nr:MAG: hypothetical protein DMD67_13070 [Gemmatimonadota bacterium]
MNRQSTDQAGREPVESLDVFETEVEKLHANAQRLSDILEGIAANGDRSGWRRAYQGLNATTSLLDSVRYRVELRLVT